MLEGFCVPVIPGDILSGAVTKLRLKEKQRPSVSLNTIQEIHFSPNISYAILKYTAACNNNLNYMWMLSASLPFETFTHQNNWRKTVDNDHVMAITFEYTL